MADDPKQEAEDVKDIISDLNDAVSTLNDSFKSFAEGLADSSEQALDLKKIFDELLVIEGHLPDHISDSADLQAKMMQDAKLFLDVKQKSFALLKDQMIKEEDNLTQSLMDQGASIEEQITAREELAGIHESMNADMEKAFILLERQAKAAERLDILFVDVKQSIDKIGNALYNPGQAIDSLLGSVSKLGPLLAVALSESQKSGRDFSDVIGEKLSKSFKKVKETAVALFSAGGILVIGVALATAAVTVLYKIFSNFWDFLDKKVMPAMAGVNKELGNMGPIMGEVKSQAVATGVQFELLGYTFDQGAQAVTKLASSMMTVRFPPEALETGLKLSEYVGLGAEQAGKLALAFVKTTGSVEGLNTVMDEATGLAHEYGIPVNQIRKDIGENVDLLARFGTANVMQMSKSVAAARSYGLTIKEVNQSFGKSMDTFDKTADVAAKLNTIFGTNINSLELMMETDPTKRMQMIRKELVAQGKDWDKLNVFEKNVITSTLGITEQQAQLAFASEKVRKKLQRQADQEKRNAKINKDWDQGLTNIKKTLLPLTALLDKLSRAAARFISVLVTGEDPGENMADVAGMISDGLKKLTGWLDSGTDKMKELSSAMEVVRAVGSVVAGALFLPFKALWEVFKLLAMAIEGAMINIETLLGVATSPTAKKILGVALPGFALATAELNEQDEKQAVKEEKRLQRQEKQKKLEKETKQLEKSLQRMPAPDRGRTGGFDFNKPDTPQNIHITLEVDGEKIASTIFKNAAKGA